MKRLTRYALIILNKFGYVPLDVEVARQLFKVISARYGRRSIVFETKHRVRRREARHRD